MSCVATSQRFLFAIVYVLAELRAHAAILYTVYDILVLQQYQYAVCTLRYSDR